MTLDRHERNSQRGRWEREKASELTALLCVAFAAICIN